TGRARPRRRRAPRPRRPRAPVRGARRRSGTGSRPGPVAHAADGLDPLRIAELLTQMADVDVDRPRFPVGVVAPQSLQERLAAEDAAGLRDERPQQLELDVGEL